MLRFARSVSQKRDPCNKSLICGYIHLLQTLLAMDNLNDATKPDILADADAPGVMLSENNAEVNLIIKEFEDELQAKVFIVIFTHKLCFFRVYILVLRARI